MSNIDFPHVLTPEDGLRNVDELQLNVEDPIMFLESLGRPLGVGTQAVVYGVDLKKDKSGSLTCKKNIKSSGFVLRIPYDSPLFDSTVKASNFFLKLSLKYPKIGLKILQALEVWHPLEKFPEKERRSRDLLNTVAAHNAAFSRLRYLNMENDFLILPINAFISYGSYAVGALIKRVHNFQHPTIESISADLEEDIYSLIGDPNEENIYIELSSSRIILSDVGMFTSSDKVIPNYEEF